MIKAVWIGLVALAAIAAQPVLALSLQDLRGPDGGPRFTDPDGASPFGTVSVNGGRVNADTDGGGAVWVPPSAGHGERFDPYVTTPPAYDEDKLRAPTRDPNKDPQ